MCTFMTYVDVFCQGLLLIIHMEQVKVTSGVFSFAFCCVLLHLSGHSYSNCFTTDDY